MHKCLDKAIVSYLYLTKSTSAITSPKMHIFKHEFEEDITDYILNKNINATCNSSTCNSPNLLIDGQGLSHGRAFNPLGSKARPLGSQASQLELSFPHKRALLQTEILLSFISGPGGLRGGRWMWMSWAGLVTHGLWL